MLIAQRPSLTEEAVDEFRSRFVIEPLEPGFGYTIGNSLRRTLLSSIPGAAVTSIRIEGEVHNPDLHIAALNGKGKLEMELTVERGRGYVSAAQNKQPGQEIGRIPIDSIYSPVLRVTYKVEATRVEQLNLTVRSYNCLKREGIHSVGELVARSEQDLLDIRNFGAKSIEEVKQKLIDMGLALKDSPPGFDPGTAADSYGAEEDDSYVETEEY